MELKLLISDNKFAGTNVDAKGLQEIFENAGLHLTKTKVSKKGFSADIFQGIVMRRIIISLIIRN